MLRCTGCSEDNSSKSTTKSCAAHVCTCTAATGGHDIMQSNTIPWQAALLWATAARRIQTFRFILGLIYSAYMWQDFKHEQKMLVCFYAQRLPVKAAVTIPCRATSWEQPVEWIVTCIPPHLFNISLSGVSCALKPPETNKSQKAHRGYPSLWMQENFISPPSIPEIKWWFKAEN